MTTLQTIRRLREQKGYSQEYMALCLGMSQNNYSKLELGKNKLTVEQLEKIAAVLEIGAKELHDHKDENHFRNELERLQQKVDNLETELSLFKKLWNHLFGSGGGGPVIPRRDGPVLRPLSGFKTVS